MEKKFDLSVLRRNRFKMYTPESVEKVGLPVWPRDGMPPISVYSKTECQRRKQPVTDGEVPVGFMRGQGGYYAMYLRTEEPKAARNVPTRKSCDSFHPCTTPVDYCGECILTRQMVPKMILTSPRSCPMRKWGGKNG